MEILWLKSQAANLGLTHQNIALLAGCSRRTVQRTLADFRDGGLHNVKQIPVRVSQSELDKHRASLEELLTQDPPRSVKHARQVIFKQTGIKQGLTQVRHFLLRLGLKPRKVAAIPIPPKSDISGDFLKTSVQRGGQTRIVISVPTFRCRRHKLLKHKMSTGRKKAKQEPSEGVG